LFVQNTWSPINNLSLETGLRGDYVSPYGFELLPRLSAMMKITPKFTARLGGGVGYKTPTVFNEEAERIQFQRVRSINESSTSNERSVGGNFDLTYRTKIGEVGLTFNHLFFYTRLNQPLRLTTNATGDLQFVNATGYLHTKGTETNLRLSYQDFKLFVGYTYADVNTQYNNTKEWFPLTARNRLNNVLMYEKEGKLKMGLEAYYVGKQKLNNGAEGRAYWTAGFMVEKSWERFSIFVNFENFTDTRQTKFGPIYSGSINNPVFDDIYAPVEGFVTNGGIKIRL
jgi:iron complex outermembrane receptor protein